MIRYHRRVLPIFERYFHDNVNGSLTFADWLAEQGAVLTIQDDFTAWATNVLIFEDPEDEIAFRLKWGGDHI